MKLSRFIHIFVLAVLLFASTYAAAVQPGEMLPDAALEARARAIGKNLRCLVCQNESIDDSDAALAHDLRVLVRQRLMAGDSDEQVKQYIVSRYGQYVLLKPPLEMSTLFLWFSPPLLLFFGVGAAMMFYRTREISSAPAPLSLPERERLNELLKKHSDGDKDATP